MNILKHKINIDPYEAFFIVLAVHFIAAILGAAVQAALNHPTDTPVWVLPLCTLGAVAIMMNLGDQNPSAKEVFWAWIVLTIAFGLLAVYGQFLVGLMR